MELCHADAFASLEAFLQVETRTFRASIERCVRCRRKKAGGIVLAVRRCWQEEVKARERFGSALLQRG